MPDFPKKGILFYDITTMLKDRRGLKAVIGGLKHNYRHVPVDVVASPSAELADPVRAAGKAARPLADGRTQGGAVSWAA